MTKSICDSVGSFLFFWWNFPSSTQNDLSCLGCLGMRWLYLNPMIPRVTWYFEKMGSFFEFWLEFVVFFSAGFLDWPEVTKTNVGRGIKIDVTWINIVICGVSFTFMVYCLGLGIMTPVGKGEHIDLGILSKWHKICVWKLNYPLLVGFCRPNQPPWPMRFKIDTQKLYKILQKL